MELLLVFSSTQQRRSEQYIYTLEKTMNGGSAVSQEKIGFVAHFPFDQFQAIYIEATEDLTMEQISSRFDFSQKSKIGKRCLPDGSLGNSRVARRRRQSDSCTRTTRSTKKILALSLEDIVVGDLIGRGGFSEVHELSGLHRQARRALKCSTSTDSKGFVIKYLRKNLTESGPKLFKRASRDLINEAAFLAKLDHPNILKPRAFVSTGTMRSWLQAYDSFGLIMERLDFTLREKIAQWKTEQREAPMKDASFTVDRLCYALEVAEALEYVHERRLVYRDLSPRNIGFKNNSVQLFDFGLCRKLPSRSQACGDDDRYLMTYAGTARYLAPEVHMRKGYNRKADVYSWAVVCYEMMSFKEPYEGMDREELFAEVCCEGYRPCMDDLPRNDDLEDLLHQSWCESLEDRLSMKEVCEVLEEIIAFTDPESDERPSSAIYEDINDESESTCSTLSVDSWLSNDVDSLSKRKQQSE
eukprot:scaffold8505_cov130-Cylindrotheca_fusiformis.AAC.10